MLTKICRKCREARHLGDFHPAKNNRDGLRTDCKACFRAAARARRATSSAEWKSGEQARCKKYAVDHPERRAAASRKHLRMLQSTNPEKLRAAAKRHVDTLSPSYVAACAGLKLSQITPELLSMKREQLEIHRLLQQIKKATNETINNNT